MLDLSSNVIDYDGITAIAEALTDNTSLKSLHIRCFRSTKATSYFLTASSLVVAAYSALQQRVAGTVNIVPSAASVHTDKSYQSAAASSVESRSCQR